MDSYKILTELNDDPDDLEIIKKEVAKINGLLQVIQSKLNEKKHQSDHLVILRKLSTHYIDAYDFTREIKLLTQTYGDDPNRIKNLRMLILNSLNDKKMIEKFQSMLSKL